MSDKIAPTETRGLTGALRWNGGVLEQEWSIDCFEGGSWISGRVEWCAVPVVQQPAEWDDRPDDLTEAIETSHPTRTGRHDLYTRAMELVGNRKSKRALVALVNHLLAENDRLQPKRRVRHKKRGSTYGVIGIAEAQAPDEAPLTDYEVVVVYQCEQDGKLWVRRHSEFEDGRFEDLESTR